MGGRQSQRHARTPRTTGQLIPGYDWDSDKGFFDKQADKAQVDFDATFGNWAPSIEDDPNDPENPNNRK
jgi:hypothetical protein